MALTLSTNEDCTRLILKSDLVNQMFDTADPVPYDRIRITIYRNCCNCDAIEYEIERTIPTPFATSVVDEYDYNAVDDCMELHPQIEDVNNTVWIDGVYKVIVTIYDSATQATTSSEENCFFLDCETSCKVAKHIKDLLKDNVDSEVYLLYFGLINGGNCNCNCDELCYLYRKLVGIIDNPNKCLCCK